MKTRILVLSALLALGGCTDREAQEREAAVVRAAAEANAAAALAKEYNNAVAARNWEMARIHGAALMAQYPGSEAVELMAPGYEEVTAKAEEAREARRVEALWAYSQVSTKGGIQRSALLYGKEPVDVDGSGAKQVQLVFRDHPEWERSAYLVLQAGDFRCPGGCKVQVKADDAPPKSMAAWRPDTDEAIAMFINDDKALWKLLRGTDVVEIEFPVKAGGTRTVVFETGGLDGAQMPGWD